MDDAALRCYVESLARPRPADGGVELVYPPEWEAAIYRHGPLNLWDRMSELRLPLLVISGAESDTFQAPAARKLKRLLPQAEFQVVPESGHLVPLERPGQVGTAILEFLNHP
jgi:pimeloyl-ACP methyl ester carboxylesterase